MSLKRLLTISTALILFTSISANATSFEGYVQRLSEHPQVGSILAESEASKAQAQGALGLPDPMFMLGVDNVPISDPAFDRFLPTSKVIGFSQAIPNPALRGARSEKLEQMSEKQKLRADYTQARLRFMLISKLAEYESVKTQQKLIKTQLGHYRALEETFKGQIESGRSVYQRFSEVDVERAEAERKLNDLEAQHTTIEAEFIRLIGEVPRIAMPEQADTKWDKNPNALYAVLIAAEDIDIAKKDVGIADAAFLPNFGVNAVYKQREDGENSTFDGGDWFSVQAQVSIPLWASNNQKPKLKAAKDRQRSAIFAYDDASRIWIKQMAAIESVRDAAGKNVNVLKDKDWAMKSKIDAVQRNYEAGTEDLDRVLLAKIDRLNIQAQLAQVKAAHAFKTAEFNSNIIGALKETEE
tara:strand:- start:18096 stop:19331 length:1236 start_codon:yes stop_codon:yes gene_type:complete